MPSGKHQEDICNYGYAEGICERFPAGRSADAVRFSVASENRTELRIVYALEREQVPVESGELRFSISTNGLISSAHSPILTAQAEAFARSYLAVHNLVSAECSS